MPLTLPRAELPGANTVAEAFVGQSVKIAAPQMGMSPLIMRFWVGILAEAFVGLTTFFAFGRLSRNQNAHEKGVGRLNLVKMTG